MGKAKWWVCGSCHSLNDLPANKCYKCRVPKPPDARIMDDEYAVVGGDERVGITVDLTQVGDLTRPDPVETQEGGGLVEAFKAEPDEFTGAGQESAGAGQPEQARHDPYTDAPERGPTEPSTPAPRPLRDPIPRGIDALGGHRQWAEGADIPEVPEAASPVPEAASPESPPGAPPSPDAPPPDAPPAPPQQNLPSQGAPPAMPSQGAPPPGPPPVDGPPPGMQPPPPPAGSGPPAPPAPSAGYVTPLAGGPPPPPGMQGGPPLPPPPAPEPPAAPPPPPPPKPDGDE